MGVGDVVLRNDIQYERYDLVSPRELAPRVRGGARARQPRKDSGRRPRRVLARPHEDEYTLVVARRTRRRPRRSSSIRSTTRRRSCAPSRRGRRRMIAGDGEGLVDAADVGLLDGAGIVQYSGTYDTPEKLRAALERRHRAGAHRLEPPAGAPLDLGARQPRRDRTAGRDADQRRPRRRAPRRVPGRRRRGAFDDGPTGCRRGRRRRATATRSPTRPRTRRARAFDGERRDRVAGRRVRGRRSARRSASMLDDPITTDRINLVQPINGARDRYITKVKVRFDGKDTDRRRARRFVAHADRPDDRLRHRGRSASSRSR